MDEGLGYKKICKGSHHSLLHTTNRIDMYKYFSTYQPYLNSHKTRLKSRLPVRRHVMSVACRGEQHDLVAWGPGMGVDKVKVSIQLTWELGKSARVVDAKPSVTRSGYETVSQS